jgi:hypothetical protein
MVKWTQEDVKKLYSLLIIIISVYFFVNKDIYEEELHRKIAKKYSWRQHFIQ